MSDAFNFPEEPQLVESSFDPRQVREIARIDSDFFAALAMPATYKYRYPPIFIALWDLLKEKVTLQRDFSQLALGLPRGFSKTTNIKLFILYSILFSQKKFILVCCENQTKANNMLADVVDMLDEPNIKAVFGDWRLGVETDRQDLKKFGFQGRNIILMAGTVGVIRGISLKNERPDLMIFDDIQSRTCAESQVESDTLERELYGTAMKAKSPHGCLFVFIGNMYPTKYSILRKLKSNPNWIKFIVGGILQDGTSLWEELQPIEQLKREFQNDLAAGHPETFYSEVLNDENANENKLVDLNKLKIFQKDELAIHAGNFVVIDPAQGKANGDAVSVGYFEVHDSRPVCIAISEGSYSPMESIEVALRYCFAHGCRCVVIESNAYQATLGWWFNHLCLQRGIEGIHAVEIYSGTLSKVTRILNMFKSLRAGEILIGEDAKAQTFAQIVAFNPMKTDNVDGILDLYTYAPRVIEMYPELVALTDLQLEMQANSLGVIEDNCCY